MSNSLHKQPDFPNDERFETVELLRNLDFGQVFLASDLKAQASLRSLKVFVELAHIPHTHLKGDQELKNLRSNLARLKSASPAQVSRIFEILPGSNEDLVVFERIEGIPLDKVIESATLTPFEIVSILLEICSGLEKLGQLGFSPFGLSPEHIVLQRDGSIKINPLSFALTTLEPVEIARSRLKQVSSRYIAPDCEILVNFSNDVFCLGVIGKELVAGPKLLRSETNTAHKLNSIWSSVRRRISRIAKPSDSLIQTLTDMTGNDRARRFPAISEVKYALANLQAELEAKEPKLALVFTKLQRDTAHRGASARIELNPTGRLAPNHNATAFVCCVALYLVALLSLFSRLSPDALTRISP